MRYKGAAWDCDQLAENHTLPLTARKLSPAYENGLVSRLQERSSREVCEACQLGHKNHNWPEKKIVFNYTGSRFLKSETGKRLTTSVSMKSFGERKTTIHN